MTRNSALYLALRLGSWLVPRLPLAAAYALATVLGRSAYYLFPTPRRAIRENLAHVLGRPAHSPMVTATARRSFEHDAKNWVDTLRIAHISDQDIVAAVNVDGWDHLDTALSAGKGLILVSMHLGNFDLVGQVLIVRGHKLMVPVERMEPAPLFNFLVDLRRSKGLNAVPIDRAPREMLSTLKNGQILGIIGDRNLGGRGVRVDFFGRKATFPRAPLSLARHTGAPLLVGLAVRLPSNRFHGYITPPVPLVHSKSVEQDERENMSRIGAIMEDFVRRFPDQWLMFAPMWDDAGEGHPTATIGQQKEAAV